jgi:hypothetical protein
MIESDLGRRAENPDDRKWVGFRVNPHGKIGETTATSK